MDRELGRQFVAERGLRRVSAGRRLPSNIDPLNAIDPSYLSLGDRLNDEFQPGQTSLNGVPLPYPGWVEQMTSCAPSVAQALRPVSRRYCDNLQGQNESPRQVAVQLDAAEAREAVLEGRLRARVVHALEADGERVPNTQRDANTWSGLAGVISPFERDRNYTISQSDTPHVLSAAFVYELPFGTRQGASQTPAAPSSTRLVSGWQLSTIYKYQSGVADVFPVGLLQRARSSSVRRCIPAIINPGAVFAQDKGSFDPALGPLFNKDAFSRSAPSTTTSAPATASRRASAASRTRTRTSPS